MNEKLVASNSPFECVFVESSNNYIYIATRDFQFDHLKLVIEIHNSIFKRSLLINAGAYGSDEYGIEGGE